MLGTFGGALEARKIDASGGKLLAEARGEIETEDGVLIIRRIHVDFTLAASPELGETVERVHSFYIDKCPVYLSLRAAIQITSSYKLISA
jgi:uncharacterized OsmC-like protein